MPIRLSENFRALFYAPFYAAHAIGAYQAEGVDVELLPSSDPARTAAALRNGEIDAMWGGPLRVMLTHAQDPAADSVCFCDVIARDPFFIIGREPRAHFHIAELSGVRFGSVAEVPTPWLCLQHDLRELGIDPKRMNRVANLTMGDNLTALRKGELDVAQMFEPYASMALQAGAGAILYAASSRGPTVYTTFLATHDSIRRNRAAFLAMIRATRRTLDWVAAHSAEELAAAVAPFYPDVPPDLLTSSLGRYRDAGLWARSPDVSRPGFDRLAESLKSGELITHMHSYEDCVDQSLCRLSEAF